MRAVLLVVWGLLALAAAGCGGETDASPPAETAVEAPVAAPVEARGEPAPAIEGITIDGKRLSLAAFRGKPVFVNVWASW